MDWLAIGKFLLTQGVLGCACLAQALVIKALWEKIQQKDEDLEEAHDELAAALERRADWLERALGSKQQNERCENLEE